MKESTEAAQKKAKDVIEKFRAIKLNEAANKVADGIEEKLTYMDFQSQHWLKIRTKNVMDVIEGLTEKSASEWFVPRRQLSIDARLHKASVCRWKN